MGTNKTVVSMLIIRKKNGAKQAFTRAKICKEIINAIKKDKIARDHGKWGAISQALVRLQVLRDANYMIDPNFRKRILQRYKIYKP